MSPDNELTAEQIAAAQESPDNNYVGEAVVVPKDGEESNYAPLPQVEENAEQNFLFYKHKQVLRFEIPRAHSIEPFKFVMGICKVRKEDEQEFLESCQGLHKADSGNIVQIRNIQNEVALKRPERSAFRGPASTSTIKAPAVPRPAVADETRMPDGGPTASPGLAALLRSSRVA